MTGSLTPHPSGADRPLMAFEYALVRAVPRVDRGECVNVGVLLYCQDAGYLALATHLDADRLRALDPHVDLDAVRDALVAIEATCQGPDAAQRSRRERFGWLTAPRSTVVQPGPVHAGVTADPDRQLRAMVERLVR